MYLLDTNIVSLLDPRRHRFAIELIPWMQRNGSHLFLSAITLVEIETGILKLRRQGRQRAFEDYARLRDVIEADYRDRILPVDTAAALATARIADAILPTIIGIMDLMIASTAQVHGLTVLTRNLRHFRPTGVPAIDPLVELPPDVAR